MHENARSSETIKCIDDLAASSPQSKKSIRLFDDCKAVYSDKGEARRILAESNESFSEVDKVVTSIKKNKYSVETRNSKDQFGLMPNQSSQSCDEAGAGMAASE